MPRRLAYFISSHGFGHASRASAVANALWRQDPALELELFTGTPEWFFQTSLDRPARYHGGTVDLGLVQSTALDEDLDATLRELRAWIPFSAKSLQTLAEKARGCHAVLCDIAPLGLHVANQLGVPGVLIENFTWDFIYRGYVDQAPALGPIIDELERTLDLAALRIQTEPFCQNAPNAVAVAPLSRRPRRSRDAVRESLGVPTDAPLILVTMGGIAWDYGDIARQLDRLSEDPSGPWLVLAGASTEPQRQGRILRLPHRSDFYHPDLIHASDAVVGKLGYSTLAETAHAGLPFAYVPRERFPESPLLERWVVEHLPHLRLDGDELKSGRFLDRLGGLVDQIGQGCPVGDGGDEIVGRIFDVVG